MNIDISFTKYGRDMNCLFNNKIYKLRDLHNDALYYHLNQDINFLTKKDIISWKEVFNNEINYRRVLKIKKIINNIK